MAVQFTPTGALSAGALLCFFCGGLPLVLRLSEGLGISARLANGLHLDARDAGCRFAPLQEQSRCSASAALAKDLAWRSAPCSADHKRSFARGGIHDPFAGNRRLREQALATPRRPRERLIAAEAS